MFETISLVTFGALIIYGMWRFFRGVGSKSAGDGPGESAVITHDPGVRLAECSLASARAKSAM
jgi:hypothetical protein